MDACGRGAHIRFIGAGALDTGQMCQAGYHNLPFLGFPRYPFIYRDSHLSKGRLNSLLGCTPTVWAGFPTMGRGIAARHGSHYTTETRKHWIASTHEK